MTAPPTDAELAAWLRTRKDVLGGMDREDGRTVAGRRMLAAQRLGWITPYNNRYFVFTPAGKEAIGP